MLTFEGKSDNHIVGEPLTSAQVASIVEEIRRVENKPSEQKRQSKSHVNALTEKRLLKSVTGFDTRQLLFRGAHDATFTTMRKTSAARVYSHSIGSHCGVPE